MNGFGSGPSETAWSLCALYGVIWVVGFAITRSRSLVVGRTASWALATGAIVAAEQITGNSPGPVRMLAIIGALLWTTKVAVTIESQTAGHRRLRPFQWFAFAI